MKIEIDDNVLIDTIVERVEMFAPDEIKQLLEHVILK